MKQRYRVLIIIYLIIAAIVTVNLLAYNQHNITQIGDKVYIKLNKNISKYNSGSLLIATTKDNYQANDNIFYCRIKDKKCDINYGTITTMMGDAPLINGDTVSKKLIIGTEENVKVIPIIGGLMNILESSAIYLCLIVIPVLVAFIYILCTITKETKKEPTKKNKKKTK